MESEELKEGNEDSKSQQEQSLDSQDQQKEEEDNSDESLSPEIANILSEDVIRELPAGAKQQIERSLVMMSGGSRTLSPIAEKVTSEHITQIIENAEKESQREFETSKINENTKRWGMGAILSLIVIVFIYAGVTKDKDLSEKVVLAGISAIGGFGAGYAVAKNQ